jgi:hypothetical protein
VSLIDLSLSGALVEHIEPIRPGEIYHLSITIKERKVPVLARAMRVFASHRVTVAGGERQVVYRTGMEFVGVEKEIADLIADIDNSMAGLSGMRSRCPAARTADTPPLVGAA